MHDADVLVFATPIYYYEMSGQMKTLLDRANPLYVRDYEFKEVYVLTSAAENEPEVPNRIYAGHCSINFSVFSRSFLGS